MGLTFGFSGIILALVIIILLSAVRIFASTNAVLCSCSGASGK